MFISKKHISRRTILQGVGASIALPLMDAMNPVATAWAGDVSGLSCLAETARYDAARARDRAVFAESLTGLLSGAAR